MSSFTGLEMAVDQPQRMIIQHPATNIPLQSSSDAPSYIDLLSPDSEAAQKHEREIFNKRLSRRNKNAPLSAEELMAERYARLAALTVGWRLASLDGQPIDVPFSTAAAVELYSNNRMTWLREQVEAFLENRANFIGSSSKN